MRTKMVTGEKAYSKGAKLTNARFCLSLMPITDFVDTSCAHNTTNRIRFGEMKRCRKAVLGGRYVVVRAIFGVMQTGGQGDGPRLGRMSFPEMLGARAGGRCHRP